MQYIFILGNHPALCASECFLALQRDGYQPAVIEFHQLFLVLECTRALSPTVIKRLGGTERIAIVKGVSNRFWQPAEVVPFLEPLPNRTTIGISSWNIKQEPGRDWAYQLKQLLKIKGTKTRFILPRRSSHLNAAQVLFNRLLEPAHFELVLVRGKINYYCAVTIQIQDIEGYEQRDTERPARDTRIGLLPPKLAQIMINLAAQTQGDPSLTILDPFCGMGTILQEGWLLGHRLLGSDSNPAMLTATRANLRHLTSLFKPPPSLSPTLFQHDVHQPFAYALHGTVDAVVTEPYLGPPSTRPVSTAEFTDRAQRLSALYRAAFIALGPLLKKNGYVLFIFPIFRHKKEWLFFPAPFLDEVARLGYRSVQLIPQELARYFSVADRHTNLYARPDAFVGRELTLWQKR